MKLSSASKSQISFFSSLLNLDNIFSCFKQSLKTYFEMKLASIKIYRFLFGIFGRKKKFFFDEKKIEIKSLIFLYLMIMLNSHQTSQSENEKIFFAFLHKKEIQFFS